MLTLLDRHKVCPLRHKAIFHRHNPVAVPMPVVIQIPMTPTEMAVTKVDLDRMTIFQVLVRLEIVLTSSCSLAVLWE